MSLYLWCLFAAAALHVISKMPVAKAQHNGGGYDNNNPRQQQKNLSGWGERALSAHQNQIESFPLFAAGVLVAHVSMVDAGKIDTLAVLYVLTRCIYLFLYIKNYSTFRSVIWGFSFFISMALLCSPAWA